MVRSSKVGWLGLPKRPLAFPVRGPFGEKGSPLSLSPGERASSVGEPGTKGPCPVPGCSERERKGEDGLGPSFLIPLPCPSPARNGGGEKFRGEEARGPPPGSPSPAGKREKERPEQTADELPPSCRPAAGSERGLAPGPGRGKQEDWARRPRVWEPKHPGDGDSSLRGRSPRRPTGYAREKPEGTG